jgi:cytochrome c-type biogenesis protein CcmF
MFPTISEALDGSRVSVGIEFFNKWATPLGLTLLFLAGAAPLLAWRKTTVQRLYQQFLFPVGLMAVTIVVLLIFFPQVTLRTPIFADSIKLPVSLVNFGLCAFVVGSILQEFWRGTAVRRKQTGGDPLSSLLGLTLSKRRKYGGYVVHLGVAVLFIGFGGKAYDRMVDRTIAVPAIDAGLDRDRPIAEREQWSAKYLAPDMTMRALPKDTPSSFVFKDYTFLYESLTDTSDDQKHAVTAQISVWHDGEKIATLYPAKWDYKKGSEATSEVSIKVRPDEDVYVVLTGYDLQTRMGNFRVFVNPLISWVWIGTVILSLGCLICLLPQSLVDRLGRPRGNDPRLGRAGAGPAEGAPGGPASAATLALVVFGGLLVAAPEARAQAEHVQAGMGMGDSNVSHASKARPQNRAEEAAMKELLCPCGCKRESIYICKCGPAADLRAWVQSLVNEQDDQGKPRFDLATKAGTDAAYDYAVAAFVGRYGEQSLATPKSSLTWLLPAVAVVGGLGLLLAAGRRIIARGQSATAAPVAAAAPAPAPTDARYSDKLDDELAETD